ncbi:Uncharacterised protein g290 [Pycnogonum litorale]
MEQHSGNGEVSHSASGDLNELGLNADNFLEKLQTIHTDKLNYGHVCAIFKHVKANKIEWRLIKNCLKQRNENVSEVPEMTLRNSFENVVKKVKKRRDSRKLRKNLGTWLTTPYTLPKPRCPVGAKKDGDETASSGNDNFPPVKKPRTDEFKENVEEEVKAKLAREIQNLTLKVEELEMKNRHLEEQNRCLQISEQTLKAQVDRLSTELKQNRLLLAV